MTTREILGPLFVLVKKEFKRLNLREPSDHEENVMFLNVLRFKLGLNPIPKTIRGGG